MRVFVVPAGPREALRASGLDPVGGAADRAAETGRVDKYLDQKDLVAKADPPVARQTTRIQRQDPGAEGLPGYSP